MLTSLHRLLWDEGYFTTHAATGLRFGVALAGYLMDQGIIPTGIDGGGDTYGKLGMVLAFLIPSTRKKLP